jgi:hypothetical protein
MVTMSVLSFLMRLLGIALSRRLADYVSLQSLTVTALCLP